MKIVYYDSTTLNGCLSVFSSSMNIVAAGTVISAISRRGKNKEYERYEMEYDIHFIFDDFVPKIDFYTVPRIDIIAYDSFGGYIGMMQPKSENFEPICYIDKEMKCYLIARNSDEFRTNISEWKDNLISFRDIACYSDRSVAENELEFIDINEYINRCSK